jgi:hypothetical protein
MGLMSTLCSGTAESRRGIARGSRNVEETEKWVAAAELTVTLLEVPLMDAVAVSVAVRV